MKIRILSLLMLSLVSFGCNSQKNDTKPKNKKTTELTDSLTDKKKNINENKVEIIQYKINKKNDNLSIHNTDDKKISFKEHISFKKKNRETLKFAIEVTNTEGYIIKNGNRVKGKKYSKNKLHNGYISQTKENVLSVLNYSDSKKINEKAQKFLVETGLLLIENDKIINELNKYKKPHLLSAFAITKQNEHIFLITKSKMTYLEFAKVLKERYKCTSATLLQSDKLSFYDEINGKKNGSGDENPILIVYEKNKDDEIDNNPKKSTIEAIDNQIDIYTFLDKKYIVCKVEKSNQLILSNPLNTKNNQQKFELIQEQILNKKKKHIFSMNAGMYDDNQKPIGLYINEREQIHELNVKKDGYGNFYDLPPNGVFLVDNKGRAEVVTTDSFLKKYNPKNIKLATQSGPMMVINGNFNKAFNEGSPNLNIRNGIGVTGEGTIYLVISEEPVNFYEFSQLFRDVLKCNNALYLDGVVSQYFSPKVNEKIHNKFPLGPIISVTN